MTRLEAIQIADIWQARASECLDGFLEQATQDIRQREESDPALRMYALGCDLVNADPDERYLAAILSVAMYRLLISQKMVE